MKSVEPDSRTQREEEGRQRKKRVRAREHTHEMKFSILKFRDVRGDVIGGTRDMGKMPPRQLR